MGGNVAGSQTQAGGKRSGRSPLQMMGQGDYQEPLLGLMAQLGPEVLAQYLKGSLGSSKYESQGRRDMGDAILQAGQSGEGASSMGAMLSRSRPSYGGGGRANISGSSGSVLNNFGGEQQRAAMDDNRAYEQQKRMAELTKAMEMSALKEKLGLFGNFLGQNGGSNTTTRESFGGEYNNVGGRPVWSPTQSVEKTTSPKLTPEMILNFLRG